MLRWLKFFAWLGGVSVVCWLWGFVPEWQILGTFLLAGAPLLLWKARDFQQPVSPAATAVVVCVVGIVLAVAFWGWHQPSNAWFGLRPVSAVFVWLALVGTGYYAFFKPTAA